MVPMHPALVAMTSDARVAELRRPAGSLSRLPRRRRVAAPAPARVRRATGWFLVRVGLRLVLPRPTTMPAR